MRYKCHCSYDGSTYSGWQRQPNCNTVQGEIEQALKRIYQHPITIHPASRTDKGVHAKDQVFHYDSEVDIAVDKLSVVINRQLPSDIYITKVNMVNDDFHARYDSAGKTYLYRITTAKHHDVFAVNYSYQYPKDIDLAKLKELSSYFIGTYDFKAFMASGSDKDNTVRTLYAIDIEKTANTIEIKVKGSGFLYHMVRIIVGTLLDYSEGKLTLPDIKKHFKAGDRQFFKRTAPATGLYLLKTHYNDGDK